MRSSISEETKPGRVAFSNNYLAGLLATIPYCVLFSKKKSRMTLLVEFIIFAGLLISSLLLLPWWKGQGKARRRYPPSLPSLPLVGSLPFIWGFNNLPEFFMRKADELGPIFTLRAGNKFVLVLNSKAAIKDALVNHSSAFSGRASLYTERCINPNSKGLGFMNTTQEWKKYHKLSLSVLKQIGYGVQSTMESRILTEFEFFTEYLLKLNGQSFNPRKLVHLLATNINSTNIFGYRHDYDLGISELGYQIKRGFGSFDLLLDVAPILRFLPFHRDKLRDFVDASKIIQKILQTEIDNSLKDDANDCFVRRYLERVGPDYDHEQLRFTLRDIFGAGTDTIATTFLWAFIALANNPGVQNRLRAEIDAVVPRDRLPSISDQHRLQYVEATILEVLRWKTVVPMALPHIILCDTNVGDYFAPAGTLVLINLYAAHMDRKVWKDPEIFLPERFLDKDGCIIRREAPIAFSLGRRSCFGEVLARAELFLVLTGLVQRFFIQPPEGQTTVDVKPMEPIVITLNPSAFNIRLIARD